MSDITDYEWSDYIVNSVKLCQDDEPHGVLELKLVLCNEELCALVVNNKDSIALAKHFYSQLETAKEKNAFLDEITGARYEY